MGQFDKPATQALELSAVSARSRRAGLLPNLALAALLGCLLLALVFWLSGGFSAFSFSNSDAPTIALGNKGPYTAGSMITIKGRGFSHFAIVALLRDGQPAIDSTGQRLAVDTDQNGAFSFTLTIPPDWGTGTHIITALDTVSQRRASLSLYVESGSGSP